MTRSRDVSTLEWPNATSFESQNYLQAKEPRDAGRAGRFRLLKSKSVLVKCSAVCISPFHMQCRLTFREESARQRNLARSLATDLTPEPPLSAAWPAVTHRLDSRRSGVARVHTPDALANV